MKNDYRRYRIKDAAPDDDYACMREVLTRRLARAETEPLPDVLMVDGGKGQLGVLVAALSDAGEDVDAISLAKERDEDAASPRVRRSGGLKAERVFLPNRKDPITLPPRSRALLLLQRVRDESHRFAIEFQRSLRSKLNFTSILEELPGIGPTKRRSLLKHFGSLREVREAELEALQAVPGVSARDAQTLRRFFDATRAERATPVATPKADERPAADMPSDRSELESVPGAESGDAADPESAVDAADPESAVDAAWVGAAEAASATDETSGDLAKPASTVETAAVATPEPPGSPETPGDGTEAARAGSGERESTDA